jgi:hypothetical protein
MRTLLLPLLLSVCTAQVDENEFLLGEQRGLEAPDFVIDGDLEVGGKATESCSIGDKSTRWKGTNGNKHCYLCMLFEEPKAWYQAKKHCERLVGGYLASITYLR